MLDIMVDPKATKVRRVEVITGTERRRRFSESEKARIVEETLRPGAVVSEIARRHGLTPQQLFTLRRVARRRLTTGSGEADALFVPAVVDAPACALATAVEERKPAEDDGTPILGFDIGGASVWIWRIADGKPPPRNRLAASGVRGIATLGG